MTASLLFPLGCAITEGTMCVCTCTVVCYLHKDLQHSSTLWTPRVGEAGRRSPWLWANRTSLPRLSRAPFTGLTATINRSHTFPCFSQAAMFNPSGHATHRSWGRPLTGFEGANHHHSSFLGQFHCRPSPLREAHYISPSEVFPPSMALCCTWLISNSQTSHIYSETHPHRTRLPGAGEHPLKALKKGAQVSPWVQDH